MFNNKNIEKCYVCKCLINKEDSYKVEVFNYRNFIVHYCQKCKPAYKKVTNNYLNGITRYYSEIEVNEEGKPIGYIKKQEVVKK